MAYRIVRSPDVEPDLAAIYGHLLKSYMEFGDRYDEAETRAARRLLGIETRLHELTRMPFQGTLLPRVRAGLRRTTKDDAVIYFETDEHRSVVHVLAVFFSGQDHMTQILARLGRA